MTWIIVAMIGMALGYGTSLFAITKMLDDDDRVSGRVAAATFAGWLVGTISSLVFVISLIHYLFF